MDYYVVSLAEATGLYLGLALQHMIRTSGGFGRWAPLVLVLIGCVRLMSGRHGLRQGNPLAHTGIYLALCSLLLVLFWPEASTFGVGANLLDASQVTSYTATQDPQATLTTAADTGDTNHVAVVLETPGFRLLLHAFTEWPLAIALRMNQRAHQPFSSLIGVSWFLGMDLPATAPRAIADWVEGCWKPSMMQDLEFDRAIRAQDLVPWGNTPIAAALASREAVPGAMTGKGYLRDNSPLGLMFVSTPGSGSAVRCDTYLAATQAAVEQWLQTERSPAGTPLSQIFFEDTGKDIGEQAQFLIYREAMRAMGGPAPMPSLAGTYGLVTAANAAAGAAQGGLRGLGTKLGGLIGLGTGAGAAVLNQFEATLQSAVWAVGAAMWFLYFAPLMFGFALQQLIGMFPFIVCYALVPESQFKPLVYYFLALFFFCCSPFWFALVDLFARWGASLAPTSQDPIVGLFNWAPAQVWGAVATVMGLVMVFLLGGAVLFASGRGMILAMRHS